MGNHLDVSNVQNVIGGRSTTNFVMFQGGRLDSRIDGGGSTSNTLSYSSTLTAGGITSTQIPAQAGLADTAEVRVNNNWLNARHPL